MADALTDRLAEMWAELDPVDDWRPHIKDAIEEITRLRAALAAPPGWVLAPAVDELAQQIRWLNGSNKMGAGSLAEKLCDWLQSRAAAPDAQKGEP